MKISIAMATYNGEQFLAEQLESIRAQTRLPDELVVSDDASTDGTLNVINSFAMLAPFKVRVLSNVINLGYAGNFDRALHQCSGDLIFISDQDDYWFKDKIDYMTNWSLNTPKAVIFACDAELTDAALVPSGRTKKGQIQALNLPEKSFVMGCCLAVRNEFLKICLPIPSAAVAHDLWLVELADRFGLVERREEVLQYYRQHGRNVSTFVANTTDLIGPVLRTKFWIKSVSRRLSSNGGLSNELAKLRLQKVCIAERKEDFSQLAGEDCTALAIPKLVNELDQLEARTNVRSAPKNERLLSLISNWRRAGYNERAGFFRALRDVMAQQDVS